MSNSQPANESTPNSEAGGGWWLPFSVGSLCTSVGFLAYLRWSAQPRARQLRKCQEQCSYRYMGDLPDLTECYRLCRENPYMFANGQANPYPLASHHILNLQPSPK